MLKYMEAEQLSRAFRSGGALSPDYRPTLGFSMQLFIKNQMTGEFLVGKELRRFCTVDRLLNRVGSPSYRPGDVWTKVAQDRLIVNRTTMYCREQVGLEVYRLLRRIQNNCANYDLQAVAATSVRMGDTDKPSVSGLIVQITPSYESLMAVTRNQIVDRLDLFVGVPYVLLMRGEEEVFRAKNILPASKHAFFTRAKRQLLIYQVLSSAWLKLPVVTTSLLGYLARLGLSTRRSLTGRWPARGIVQAAINNFDAEKCSVLFEKYVLPCIFGRPRLSSPFGDSSKFNQLMYLLNNGIGAMKLPQQVGHEKSFDRKGIIHLLDKTPKGMFDKRKALARIRAARAKR